MVFDERRQIYIYAYTYCGPTKLYRLENHKSLRTSSPLLNSLNPCNLYSWKLICCIASSHCNFYLWSLWHCQEPIIWSECHGAFTTGLFLVEHFFPRKWEHCMHSCSKATWRLTVQFLLPHVNRTEIQGVWDFSFRIPKTFSVVSYQSRSFILAQFRSIRTQLFFNFLLFTKKTHVL